MEAASAPVVPELAGTSEYFWNVECVIIDAHPAIRRPGSAKRR